MIYLKMKSLIKNVLKVGFTSIAFSLAVSTISPLDSWAEEQELSFDKDVVTYKVGLTTYSVKRIQEHQPHIKSVNVALKCGSSKIWMKHFYKFGMCEVKAADFDSKTKTLKIKYFSHDLKTGDNYLCEKNPKFLEIDLPDSCRPK